MVPSGAGKFLIRSSFVVLGALAVACSHSNPAGPTPDLTSGQSAGVQATVAGVLPASLPPSGTAQTLMVDGGNFQPGLTVELMSSSGGATTFGGSAITNLTETSFQVSVRVSEQGAYQLRVINPASRPSESVTVTATPSETSAPTVAGLSPGSPTQNDAVQGVYVAGTNFQAGLHVTLTLPGGGSMTVDGSSVVFGSPTMIKMFVVLHDAGSYKLRVVNSSGQTSEPWTFTVKGVDPTPATPVVTGLSPSSPTTNSSAQYIYVAGSGFEAGLSVALTRPNGETSTIAGSAINFGSSSGFKMSVLLGDPGSHSLRVINPSGKTSEPWTFTVKPPEAPQAPVVTGISPESPSKKSEAQGVYVSGDNFASGLTVVLTRPNGEMSTIGGSAIYFGSPTVFKMMVVLADVGAYSFKVVNPAGLMSNVWTFTVKVPEVPTPSVSGLSPSSPTQSSSPQQIYVGGTGFESGLFVTLTLPGGGTTTIGGSAITFGQTTSGSSSSFKMTVVLADAGVYSMTVTNPSGKTSAPKSFTVKSPESLTPTVTGLSPSSPTLKAEAQGVYVAGTNFQEGLSVLVTRPNGETSTIGGSAIYFGSATIFKMNLVLGVAGDYSMRVVNPSGKTSDAWAFTVKAPTN